MSKSDTLIILLEIHDISISESQTDHQKRGHKDLFLCCLEALYPYSVLSFLCIDSNKAPKVMMKQPWVLIVAFCPKASDWQSEAFGLPVRRGRTKTSKAIANQFVWIVASGSPTFFPSLGHPS